MKFAAKLHIPVNATTKYRKKEQKRKATQFEILSRTCSKTQHLFFCSTMLVLFLALLCVLEGARTQYLDPPRVEFIKGLGGEPNAQRDGGEGYSSKEQRFGI